MKKTLFLSLICILTGNKIFAQQYICHVADTAATAAYRDHNVDMQRMKVVLNFEPAVGKVNGKVTHYFTPNRPSIDTLFLDAPGVTISSCKLNGADAKYTTNAKGITLQFSPALKWNSMDSVTIEYTATPRKGIYFIGWNDASNRSQKQIWTQGEAEDNRFWIPMYDNPNDKMITETVVTFDKDYNVLGNGLLLNGKKNTGANMIAAMPPVNADGKTRTWHYKLTKPHAGYLLMLGIGKYLVKNSVTSSGVKIANWYYPEWEERAEPTYRYTAESMDFLEKETGVKYPWDCFSNIMVQDFIYGAMENTGSVIYGDFISCDNRAYIDGNYLGVNNHEMNHQWFGDLITCKAWNDIWLQESFATYYTALFFKDLYGNDTYQWNVRGNQNSAIDAGKKDRLAIRNCSSGGARIYQKGASVLDMLRNLLGEEAYRKAVTYYLTQNGYKNVATHNFEDAFKDVLGVDLDWFFDQWVYRGGEPAYTVSYQNLFDKQAFTRFTVNQTQLQDEVVGLFKMPINFEVYYTDGTKDAKQEWVSKQTEFVDVPNAQNKKVSFVLFDAGNHVLKTVNFKKSTLELLAQLSGAPEMIDRYDALVALRDVPADDKRNALVTAYNKEKFFAMRQEIIQQLAKDGVPATAPTLTHAFNDVDVNVRLAAINNVTFSDSFKPYFEKSLKDSSYNVVQASLTKLVAQNTPDALKYLEATSKVYGMCNRVRIKWLELAVQYAPQNKQIYLDELVDLTSPGFEFRTRLGAVAALKTLNYIDNKFIGYLFDSQCSTNNRLAGGCKPTLDYFYSQAAGKFLIQDYYKTNTWTADQKKVLEAYSK